MLIELDEKYKKSFKNNRYIFDSILTYTNPSIVRRLSKLFFCNNSLKLLKYQDLDNHISKKMKKSFYLINNFNKWIQKTILPIDQLRFIIFSGVAPVVASIY